jgi:hypothetical protein
MPAFLRLDQNRQSACCDDLAGWSLGVASLSVPAADAAAAGWCCPVRQGGSSNRAPAAPGGHNVGMIVMTTMRADLG